MVDISTFLTEGAKIPEGSALKAAQSQTILPEWYSNYAMQLLSNQQAQMATPYPTYQGPRAAEFSPAQQQAFGMTGEAAGAYKPALSQATSATQNLMGQTALGGAQPYFTQAAGMSGAAAAQPFYGQATGMSGVAAATPGLQQAAQLAAQSSQALGQQAAQPYLGAAGQTSVANIGAYMNPYTQQVVNRISEMAGRNLRENIMPGVEGRYVAAGQLGYGPREGFGTPSGMLTDTARAIRDTQEAALAEQSKALQAGYGEAGALAGADLARQAQLAQTAGALGTQQQGALAQAGQMMADIGKTYGGLTGAQQELLATIGTQLGGLTAGQQRALTEIGSQIGQIGGADISRQLGAAQQLAGMGETAQTLGLRGAGAVGAVGQQQQEQAQKNLDVAYGDFLRQQGYNQEQINNALATFKGVAPGVPTASQEYGIVPVGTDGYKPSTAASIGGALAGLAGILDKADVI